MNVRLRPGRPDDAERLGTICYEAFRTIAERHGFPPDFPDPAIARGLLSSLLARDSIYAVVAEADGRAVGSNFLWEHAPVAGVGPITVDSAVQDGAIGRRLMEDVLERASARGFASVRLVQAAYHARSLSLYTKLGFDAREPLSIMQGPAPGLHLPGYAVRAVTDADLAACNALCAEVHGHARAPELAAAVRQGSATLVERDQRVTGYATTVGFMGHAVARSNDDLQALIAAAPSFPGLGFLLPTRNSALLRWCLAHGLRVVQPMTLMSRGLYNEPAGAFLPSIIY